MEKKKITPYVPEETTLRELTLRAIILGVIMAGFLGAANAYIGLKAGMTIAATFPAAVVAMAVMKIFKGSVLEENISRTTASVGEALVAGAIFTLPAFLIAGVWSDFNYWDATLILLIGGILGVLFIIFLRRALVEETDLQFPESLACSEIVKAGQKGETGAGYVFKAMGLSAFIELIKNASGFQIIKESVSGFLEFSLSKVQFLRKGLPYGEPLEFKGGLFYQSPISSPAFMGVGYIIGPRLASIVFAGGVFAWLILIPLILFVGGTKGPFAQIFNHPDISDIVNQSERWQLVADSVWRSIVRPIAVGAMLIGVVNTLFNLRKSLYVGLSSAVRDMREIKTGQKTVSRLSLDLPFKWVLIAIGILIIPIWGLYYYFSGKILGSIISALVMVIAGFLFAAIAGYLVGVIGSSNNPISGLTLSTLIIAALLMVSIGLTGKPGIAAVLGVAAVVCCSCGIAGDMIQDLKIGQILGGTPWKMEIAEIIGVIFASFMLVFPMSILHQADIKMGGMGIGGTSLPAPQAGLMAMLSQGIVGGEMAWSLVFVGMMFCIGLILLKVPSPMIIAVGMYLPFNMTSAMFVGGVIKFILDKISDRKKLPDKIKEKGNNVGILIASGLIAGEALTGVLLAVLVIFDIKLFVISQNSWLALVIFGLIAYILIKIPYKAMLRTTE
jgi:putative OPT family oligopeptide transporter